MLCQPQNILVLSPTMPLHAGCLYRTIDRLWLLHYLQTSMLLKEEIWYQAFRQCMKQKRLGYLKSFHTKTWVRLDPRRYSRALRTYCEYLRLERKKHPAPAELIHFP